MEIVSVSFRARPFVGWLRRVGGRWSAIAVTVAVVAAGAPIRIAAADETESKTAAKAKLEKGADLLVSHAYSHALTEFEDAYRLFPSPKIFFDIGLANVGLARDPEALRAFQRFVIETTDASPETIARAKAQIQALLPKVAIVDVASTDAGLEIVVDDLSVGRTPLTGPLYLVPGQHRLLAKASDNGAPVAKTFDVTAGTRARVSVPVVPKLAVAPPPASTAGGSIVSAASLPPPLVERHAASETSAGEAPLYEKPWFWAAAAGVAAAVGVTLLLTVGRSTNDPKASLGSGTIPGGAP